MTIRLMDSYQEQAMSGAVHVERGQSTIGEVPYGFLGLVGEVGEAANVIKKYLRGSIADEETYEHFIEEMGDALWYFVDIIEAVSEELGRKILLSDIARANIKKLADKKKADPNQSKETK